VRRVPELTVLRVFTGNEEKGGNPLGVFLDGGEIDPTSRQAVAADLAFSETVFVDDPARGTIAIYTPAAKLDFAGHPTVGTAWLLAERRRPVEALHPPAGEVPVRLEGGLAYVAARPEWGPPFELQRLDSPAAVDALDGPPGGHDLIAAYAFIDEDAGLVRARVFPVSLGIPEDEATGAAAVQLCARLGRAIDIRQGRGSRILARPLPGGRVELGGRVVLDEVRTYSVISHQSSVIGNGPSS
jgi:predicted PhzF superfamily epimerase YddE/YHI9